MTAAVVSNLILSNILDENGCFYPFSQVAPLTPTVPSPTQSVGRSSLTDVDVVPILTARFVWESKKLVFVFAFFAFRSSDSGCKVCSRDFLEMSMTD